MLAALTSPFRQAAPAEARDWRALFNWLGCWLILPNLPFLPVTLMGGPPRGIEIVSGGVVGLLVHRRSYPLRLAVYIAVVAYFTLQFITHMFNMGLTMILSVIGLVFDIDLMAAPEYIAGVVLLVLSGCNDDNRIAQCPGAAILADAAVRPVLKQGAAATDPSAVLYTVRVTGIETNCTLDRRVGQTDSNVTLTFRATRAPATE